MKTRFAKKHSFRFSILLSFELLLSTLLFSSITALSFSPTLSWAQTAKKDLDSKSSSPKKTSVEKIEVTGSYIKRIDVEGPSPMETIDSEVFQVSGTNTVNDMIRENPLFYSSNNDGRNEGGFGFHGQHGGNTLVLLNGLRIPKMGRPGSDFFNGFRSLPTMVIDRVDILKDGSSALYGSDAMAGVVNFVTKKDMDGVEFNLRTTVPELGVGVEQNYGATYGSNWSRGNFMVSAQYVDSQGYTERQVGSYATVPTVALQNNYSLREGRKKALTSDSLCENCQIDRLGVDQVATPKQNLGAFLTGRVDLSDNLELSTLAMYNRRSKTTSNIPGLSFQNSDRGSLKSIDLSKVRVGGLETSQFSSSTEGQFFAQLPETLGLLDIDQTENNFSGQVRLQGFLGDTWTWSLEQSAGYLYETNLYSNGVIQRSGALGVLQSGVDLANLNKDAFASLQVTPEEIYQSQLFNSRVYAAGELLDFNNIWGTGGPLSLAVGADANFERIETLSDIGLTDGSYNVDTAPRQSGTRQVGAVFAELAAYPLKNLEVQLASRLDAYSDFGNTFNPKVAMSYRPTKQILFRSSYGTNFHAPSISNTLTQEYTYVSGVNDQGKCGLGAKCDADQVFVPVTRYRDPNLTHETSDHINFGFVVQPSKQWTFTVDQFNYRGKGPLGQMNPSVYTEIEGITGGDPAAMDALGANIDRDENDNLLGLRVPEVFNRFTRDVSGLDIGIEWTQKLSMNGKAFNFRMKSSHSHTLRSSTQTHETLPLKNREDLNWRNTTTASLSNKKHSLYAAARTSSGSTRAFSTKIETHTEYDLTYSWRMKWGGSLTMGVKNIFNATPPVNLRQNFVTFGNVSGGFDPRRRRYVLGYSQTL